MSSPTTGGEGVPHSNTYPSSQPVNKDVSDNADKVRTVDPMISMIKETADSFTENTSSNMEAVRKLADYLVSECFVGPPIYNIASTATVQNNSKNTDSAFTDVNTNPKNHDKWNSWQERHYDYFLSSFLPKETLNVIVSKTHDFLNQKRDSKTFESIKNIARFQLGIFMGRQVDNCKYFLDLAGLYRSSCTPLTALFMVCSRQDIFQDDIISVILNDRVEER